MLYVPRTIQIPDHINKSLILWSRWVAGRCESMPLFTRTNCMINMPTLKRFPQWLHSVVWSDPSTLLNMIWICCWSNAAISRFISVITVMVCRWELSSSAATKLLHLLGDFITVCTLMVFSPIAKTPRCYLRPAARITLIVKVAYGW